MPPALSRSRSTDADVGEFGTATISRDRTVSPQTTSGPTFDRNKVIGPKSGARILASEEAQARMKKADNLPEGVSVSNVVESSDDSNSSSRGPVSRKPVPLSPSPVPDPSHTKPPTPPTAKATTTDDSATGRHKTAPEGNLNELTRRASVEDVLIQANGNATPARERRASVSRGIAAGLATPFNGGGGGGAKKEREPEPTKYYPPTAATASRQRSRSNASTSSTGSTNKDVILTQLADALKKERKKCEMYQKELLVIEEELDEVEQAMSATKEKYEGIIGNQKETIENLRAELKELSLELEHAHDLDAKDAEQYLALLGPPSPPKTSSPSIISGKTQETRFREQGLSSSPSHNSTPTKSRTVRRLDNLAATASASPDGTPEKPTRISDKPMMTMFRRGSKKRSASPSPAPTTEEQGLKVTEKPARPASPGPAKLTKSSIRRVPAPTPLNLPVGETPKPPKAVSRPPVTGLNPSAPGGELPRKRRSSLERIGGTLRNMFPPLGAATAPQSPTPSLATLDQEIHREANIQAWIKASDVNAIRGDNVGSGYANLFRHAPEP
ncbi:hypothetical protein RQP46_007091 [Phenoliferia psychrophenolica]